MDEVRITKGVARWISNFIPPNSAHTPDANDVLLLHGDESNAVFTDSSNSSHNLTNNNVTYDGNGQFSGAMNFNGSNSYLALQDSEDWNFGNSDFTIDFWYKGFGISDRHRFFNQL